MMKLKPQLDDSHFADNNLTYIFLKTNFGISLKISLTFVSRDSIKSISIDFANGMVTKQPTSQTINYTNDDPINWRVCRNDMCDQASGVNVILFSFHVIPFHRYSSNNIILPPCD